MRMQIREFADFTGVSVRTLHYYDEIGLLTPAHLDAHTGYRYYDDSSLLRMQEILFYRELDFSLKRIGEILSDPKASSRAALADQKQLLILKKERLERLIAAIDDAMKGENIMNAFDCSEMEQYKAEARERWGHTEAWQEHAEKTRHHGKQDWNSMAEGMDHIMGEFALCMRSGEAPDSAEAQRLVQTLQDYITRHCYTCTPAILAGLGQMYVADDRFRANIDKHGDGTAAFISEAIAAFCQ